MLKLQLIITLKDKIWHWKTECMLDDKNPAIFLDCQNEINLTPI